MTILISIGFIITSVFVYLKTYGFPEARSWDLLGMEYFPRMLAIIIVILSIATIIKEVILRKKKGFLKFDFKILKKYIPSMITISLMFVYIFAWRVLGFIVSSIIFVIFLKWYLNQDNKFSIKFIIIPVITPILIYFIFNKFLNVMFPWGVLNIESLF